MAKAYDTSYGPTTSTGIGSAIGALTGANKSTSGNKNTGSSNQYPNANSSSLQGTIDPDRGSTGFPYYMPGGNQYPNANSSSLQGTIDPDRGGSASTPGSSPNTFQDPTVSSGGSSGGSGGGGGSYSAPARAQYEAPTLPSATSQEGYIKSMYDASRKAQEEALRAAYEKNTGALDYQESRIAPTYDAAANNAGAQAAIQRANFNESANAAGLNTGAGSQAELSMRNAEAANISAIRKAQADAQAELDYQRSQLTLEYQNAIREAIAKNELEKAQALYEEAKRVDESLVSTGINQANLNWQIWRYNNG